MAGGISGLILSMLVMCGALLLMVKLLHIMVGSMSHTISKVWGHFSFYFILFFKLIYKTNLKHFKAFSILKLNLLFRNHVLLAFFLTPFL